MEFEYQELEILHHLFINMNREIEKVESSVTGDITKYEFVRLYDRLCAEMVERQDGKGSAHYHITYKRR